MAAARALQPRPHRQPAPTRSGAAPGPAARWPRPRAVALPTPRSSKEIAAALVTINSKRQLTLPARLLAALGVNPGDRLELQPSPQGFLLQAKRVDPSRLAPLRGKLSRPAAAFDVQAFREQRHDPTLRD